MASLTCLYVTCCLHVLFLVKLLSATEMQRVADISMRYKTDSYSYISATVYISLYISLIYQCVAQQSLIYQ